MNDWRAYRPAIWLAMLGIALMLLVSPVYVGARAAGAALGVGWGIRRRRSGQIRQRRPRSG